MAKLSSVSWAAVMLGAAISAPIVAWAGPVTKADLAGKKICWSDGNASYGKNGSFDSTGFGHGTWSLQGDQLVVSGASGGFTATITKENGAFHAVGYRGYDAWGKYCK